MDELVAAAQQLLVTSWAYPVRLRIQDPIRSWGRHTLLRCRVKDGPATAPDFVIVKAANQPERGVGNERAGLRLLAGLPVRELVPELYAADPADSMLVLEDVGDGPSLGQLLRARADWAETALRASMRGLAAVHSSSRGLQERFARLHAGPAGEPATGEPADDPVAGADLTGVLTAALPLVGLPAAAVPTQEVHDAAARMSPPGPLRCLTFYDQCPTNRIMANDRLRIIDLEQVAFSHPFLDGAYPLLRHLLCMDGLRLPARVQQDMLATYRAGLADAYPELTSPGRFEQDLASACAVAMLRHLQHLTEALAGDRVVGHYLIRRRARLLAVLDAFIAVAEGFDQLPGLQEVCQRLREQLAARWDSPSLPLFPIWRT